MYVTKQNNVGCFWQLLSESTFFEKHNCLDRQLHHAALTEDQFARTAADLITRKEYVRIETADSRSYWYSARYIYKSLYRESQ